MKNQISFSDILFFLIICGLIWFTNKQHDHIVYLEDTVKIQDQAMAQQSFLIECQKIYIDSSKSKSTKYLDLFKYE